MSRSFVITLFALVGLAACNATVDDKSSPVKTAPSQSTETHVHKHITATPRVVTTAAEPKTEYMDPPAATTVLAVKEITQGTEVNIQEHLVPGQITLFDFFSQYCPPCVQVMPLVHDLAEGDPEVALRIVNINREGTRGIDWSSPVAKQYHLSSIPHFKVFGKDGQLIAEGAAGMQWFQERYRAFKSAQ